MKPTSVIIMDTHPIIRMSIEVLLQKNSELQIVLKTDDYRITIDYLRTRPVDLIIMDWICPYISRHLLSLNPLQARCRRYSRGER